MEPTFSSAVLWQRFYPFVTTRERTMGDSEQITEVSYEDLLAGVDLTAQIQTAFGFDGELAPDTPTLV